MSESALARETGVCQPVVHRIASGETTNPKIESLRPIAKHFSISISQLIGDEPLRNYRTPSAYSKLGTVPLIAFIDIPNWLKNRTAFPDVNEVFIDLDVGPNAFAATIEDTTMRPRFPEGALLIIDPEQAQKDRDFVVVQLTDQQQPTLKQLLLDGDHKYLKPLNPDFPTAPWVIGTKILGTMVQARIDYREPVV